MPRDSKVYLEDILEASAKIRSYTRGMTFEKFRGDEKTLDAVVRTLEIIGEAVKKIAEATRAKHPQVEWKKIGRMRDILIHEYFGVDVEIVWDVVENKLPALEKEVGKILKS